MTAQTTFIIAAAVLVIAVLGILLPPLWRAPKDLKEHANKNTRSDDQRQANLAIFRQQLAELERDLSNGALAAADFEQARSELQRRLLDEVNVSADDEARPAGAPRHGPGARKTALALLVALPLAAGSAYVVLGQPQALVPAQSRTPAQERVSTPEIDALLVNLVEKLKKNPDDGKGWVMLARS